MATSGTFYVWATLLSERAASNFVAQLVRRGFNVGPLANSHTLTTSGEVSCLCAIIVEADHIPDAQGPNRREGTVQGWVLDEVAAALRAGREEHYSLIVQHVGGQCTWRGSNITLPKEKPKKAAPRPEAHAPVGAGAPVVEERPPTVLDRVEKAIG